jgi:hypothetical protein
MAALEKQNRDFYYATVQARNSMFRAKAADYLLLPIMGSMERRARIGGGLEEEHRAQARAGSEYHAESGPGGDSEQSDVPAASPFEGWHVGDIGHEIGESDRRRGAWPKTGSTAEDLAAVYGKVFAGLRRKATPSSRPRSRRTTPDSVVTGFTPEEMQLINFPFEVSKSGDLTTEAPQGD